MNSSDTNFFGTRLKLARKMAGLSLQDLSNILENIVTKQALNKYEQGLMNPSTEVLLSLSKVLNVRPDYFLKKDEIVLGNIYFRKKESLLKKSEESIIEKARDYVERFLEIESIVGIESEFINPIKEKIIRNENDVEEAAELLRKAWELGNSPIPNIVEMLELKGVKVSLIDETDEIDGFSSMIANDIPLIVVNIRNKPVERIRFTLIHELAHIILSFEKSLISNLKHIEKLSHLFSSCFLLPKKLLIKLIGGLHRNYIDIKELITIKEYFGISIKAILYRLSELSIITKNYYQRWMIYLSKNYGQKNEPGEYKAEERQRLFQKLVYRALAEGLISISKAASLCDGNINDFRSGAFGII
jgi:Zn-dependent peptidase ImmA (M78 family)/DNA-binding XRE family transcriptional regulator